MIIYVWIVCLLFMGFLLLFGRMRWLEKLWELLHRTREGMDRATAPIASPVTTESSREPAPPDGISTKK